VTPDPEAARVWVARGAAAGLREAQVALAEMLVNGRGGPRDTAAALELFAKAAVEGHSGAMFALGARSMRAVTTYPRTGRPPSAGSAPPPSSATARPS